MIRAIKGAGLYRRKWLVVKGEYHRHAEWKAHYLQRWSTTLVISVHDTKAEAEATAEAWQQRGQRGQRK